MKRTNINLFKTDFACEETSTLYLTGYYHFRSTLKRDDFFAYVYVLNLTVLSGYVSLETNETLSVLSRN